MIRFLIINLLFALLIQNSWATCKSVQLREQLVLETCLEEKHDSRKLPYVVKVRQKITNVSTKPLAVWGYFDPFISGGKSIISAYESPPLYRHRLNPLQSVSFNFPLNNEFLKQFEATNVYYIEQSMRVGVSDDLSLKTPPEINEFDWSKSYISFDRVRLLPTLKVFAAEKHAIEATSVPRALDECEQSKTDEIEGVHMNGCLTKTFLYSFEFENNRLEPIYVACPKSVGNRFDVAGYTPSKTFKNPDKAKETDQLFLLRPAQTLQLRYPVADIIPFTKGTTSLSLKPRCNFYNWYEPRNFQMIWHMHFDVTI